MHGIVATTTVDPVPNGGRLTEIRLVRPILGAHATLLGGRAQVIGTANLEGLTVPSGELTPGAWGEGFIDRRHPHTYGHELIATLAIRPSGAEVWNAGVVAGKGIVPFGTDDPMSRPTLRYPVNHHWAQILERLLLGLQVRAFALTVEAAVFNGDEPETPHQWPRLPRLGDSWSGRVTLAPSAGLELQGSFAQVRSPEHRGGAGLDHERWSLSSRLDRSVLGKPVYALVEWAGTSEGDGFFQFRSFLVEGAVRLGRHRPYYRYENTERPEEERVSAFRSRRPPLDNAILGTSRWTIHTVGYAWLLAPADHDLEIVPFIEWSGGSIAKVGGGVFEIVNHYKRPGFWSVSAGLDVRLGFAGHRMGRYGLLHESGPVSHQQNDR